MQLLHRTLGLPAQVADIERLRRAFGQEKVVLIGHSFGGFLAALYAAEFPERVRGLVLVCPAPLFVMPPPDGGLYEEIRRLLPEAQRAPYQRFLKRAFDFRAMLDSDEESLAALNRELGPFYAAAAKARGFDLPVPALGENAGGWMVPAIYLGLGKHHDWTQVAAGFEAPVLVLHGEQDLQSETATRSYLGVFPKARFEVVEGAGHFPFEEQPQAFAEIVGSFLAGL
jgi:proline iminopeptidase